MSFVTVLYIRNPHAETSRKTDLSHRSRNQQDKKLLSLDHLIELEYVTFHDNDVPLEVNSAFVPCLNFANIEWSDLQIHDFS